MKKSKHYWLIGGILGVIIGIAIGIIILILVSKIGLSGSVFNGGIFSNKNDFQFNVNSIPLYLIQLIILPIMFFIGAFLAIGLGLFLGTTGGLPFWIFIIPVGIFILGIGYYFVIGAVFGFLYGKLKKKKSV